MLYADATKAKLSSFKVQIKFEEMNIGLLYRLVSTHHTLISLIEERNYFCGHPVCS